MYYLPNGQATVRYGSQTTVSDRSRLDLRLSGGRVSFRRATVAFFRTPTRRRRVAVIGDQVGWLSLPDARRRVHPINGEWLKIIGLLEAKGEIFGQSQDNQLIIPFTTMSEPSGQPARARHGIG